MEQFNNNALIEGLIFISGDEGISYQQIAKQLNLDFKVVNEIIAEMKHNLDIEDSRGICLMMTGNIVKFTTKYQHATKYYHLFKDQTRKLSTAALETLAIIAYQGPIVKSGIEKIRGVSSDAMIAKLKAQELIIEVGKSDLPGKPFLYAVSQQFLDYFHLKSLKNLPPLPDSFFVQDEETNLFSY